MRSPHTKSQTLSDKQVESHIREWKDSADRMENMSVLEARRYVSGRQPDLTRFAAMAKNMEHKIRQEAPSKDAEQRMLAAWKRREEAYSRILAMITTSSTATVIEANQLDSGV